MLLTTALAVIALAGCSSSAKTPAATPTPTAVPPETLSKIVLQKTDVPADWKSETYTQDADQAKNDAELSTCLGTADNSSKKVNEENSDSFSSPDGKLQLQSSATAYPSIDVVNQDIDRLKLPKLSECFTAQFTKLLSKDAPAGTTVAPTVKVTAGDNGGPANVVGKIEVKADVQGSDGPVSVYVNEYLIAKGSVEADVTVTSVGAPVEETQVSDYVVKVAGRLSS